MNTDRSTGFNLNNAPPPPLIALLKHPLFFSCFYIPDLLELSEVVVMHGGWQFRTNCARDIGNVLCQPMPFAIEARTICIYVLATNRLCVDQHLPFCYSIIFLSHKVVFLLQLSTPLTSIGLKSHSNSRGSASFVVVVVAVSTLLLDKSKGDGTYSHLLIAGWSECCCAMCGPTAFEVLNLPNTCTMIQYEDPLPYTAQKDALMSCNNH